MPLYKPSVSITASTHMELFDAFLPISGSHCYSHKTALSPNNELDKTLSIIPTQRTVFFLHVFIEIEA